MHVGLRHERVPALHLAWRDALVQTKKSAPRTSHTMRYALQARLHAGAGAHASMAVPLAADHLYCMWAQVGNMTPGDVRALLRCFVPACYDARRGSKHSRRRER